MDIFLEDLTVSPLHAKLHFQDGTWVIEDNDSANGVKVNGHRLSKYQIYPLQEGDRILIGQTVLVFSNQ